MKTRIALVIFCLALTACTAGGQPGQAPAAAGTAPAGDAYGQPAAPTNTQFAQQAQQPAATVPPAAAAPTATQPVAAATQPAATQPAATQPPAAQPTATLLPPPPAATPTTPPAAAVNPTAVPVTGQAVLIPADELLDYQVADASGTPLGDVDDLIIDLGSTANGVGQAPMLVISSDLNDDLHIPVPWRYAQIRHDWKAVILPVNANQLMNAPAFNEDFWPADLLTGWQADLDRYWQNPAAAGPPAVRPPNVAGAQPATGYLRVSDLLDMDIIDPRGFELGEVKDLAIDWQNSTQAAQFSYLIMDRGDSLGLGGENIPIPWRLIRPNPLQEVIPLNIQAQILQTAPSFNDLGWPNLYAEPWTADLTRFWNAIQ